MLKKGFISMILLSASAPLFANEYWIDVRLPMQYQQRHLSGAINLPLAELRQKVASVVKNKGDTIYLYCNSGRQSAMAKNMLEELGYNNVVDEGGFDEALAKQQAHERLKSERAAAPSEDQSDSQSEPPAEIK